MKLFFQLALGACPAVILFLILTLVSIKKKSAGRVVNISLLSLFSVMAAVFLVVGLTTPAARNGLASGEVNDLSLQLTYAVAQQGNAEMALDMLNDIRQQSADSAEVAECAAWIYAARGDAVNAKALFVKANVLGSVDDYDTVIACCDEALTDSGSSVAQNALVTMAQEKMDKKADGKRVKALGKVLTDAEKVYDDFLTNDRLDSEAVNELVEEIDDACDSNPDFARIAAVRVCRVKLLALNQDFEAIAESIDDNSTFGELAIAAELYVNNLITADDFSDEYGEDYEEVAEAVVKQLQKVAKNISDEEAYKKKQLDTLLDTLDTDGSDPAVSRLEADLRQYGNDENSPHRPKAYMQLARLDYAQGDDAGAAQNISAALNTIGISNDANFSTPMIGIVDAITDTEDVNKVKDIAQYAEQATDYSSDYLVVKAIESYQANPDNKPSDDEDNADDTDGPAEEERNPFELFFADTASQKRNAFSITSVDATAFETVKLVVNVDPSISITADELKSLISLKDCNVEIENFTIEKVEYSGANILLCCDTSGSMGGQPIADLRAAVEEFVRTSTDIENVSLVTFDDSVDKEYLFDTDKADIIAAAQTLYSGGGTNMYGALQHCITRFSQNDNELNFVLLLSDGQDGYSPSEDEIQNNIAAPFKDTGTILISLGLGGSVDVDYMNTLATATGGYFVYATDSATLSNFYDQLRSQILNRYVITFTAKDTLRASREVTIALKDAVNDRLVSATKHYEMNGTDVSDPTAEEESDSVSFNGFTVSGLDTRRIYKSGQAVTVNLKGTGFTDAMSFKVKLDGKLNYESITCTYVDATTVELRLPGGIACGQYDLVVTVDGKTGYFAKELTVSAKGAEKTTTFGNYVFTSDSRTDTDDGVVLSGYVTMNGWLHFNGDVVISGDLSSTQVRVTDMSGSYIQYYADSAEGLAKLMAQHNMVLSVPALGNFTLYKDVLATGNDEDHRVDTIAVPLLYLSNVAELTAPGLELYPDKIVLKSNGFNTKFPFQDKLMKAASVEDLFSFELEAEVYLTNTQIDMQLEVSNDPDGDVYTNRVPSNLGLQPIYTTPLKYEIKINTLKHEYSVKLGVQVAFIKADGLSLALEWTKREEDTGAQFLVPKKVEIGADIPIKATIGAIPVTYRDFAVGLDDIDPNKNVLYWKLTGRFDLEAATVSEYIPALKEYIDDPAVLKLNDTTVTISLGQIYIGIETEAQLLEAISLGKLKIEAGKIPYSSVLLGMEDRTGYGLRAELKAGITWKTNNIDIDISGTGAINLHHLFFGVELSGVCDLKVSWWIFEKEYYKEGQALIGFVNNDRGGYYFAIKARTAEKKGAKEVYVYIDQSGLDCGSKKL